MAKNDPGHESDSLVAELRCEAGNHRRGVAGVPVHVAGLLAIAADEIAELRRELGKSSDLLKVYQATQDMTPPAPAAGPAPRVRRGRPPKPPAPPVPAVESPDGTLHRIP
jgi:hypothetical protein